VNPQGFTVVISLESTSGLNDSSMALSIAGPTSSDLVYLQAVSGDWWILAQSSLGGSSVYANTGIPILEGQNVLALSIGTNYCKVVGRGAAAVYSSTVPFVPLLRNFMVGGYLFDVGYTYRHFIRLHAFFPRTCTEGELRAFVNNF